MGKFNDLVGYQKAFTFAMEVFAITKKFPREEIYSLTDQIRRSSRSVCSNLAESYNKRRYPKHFIAKLSDADMENTESQCWLEFAYSCHYISAKEFQSLMVQSEEVGKILGYMIRNPKKFI